MQHNSCESHSNESAHSCHPYKGRPDYLLWGSLVLILLGFILTYGGSKILQSLGFSGDEPGPVLQAFLRMGENCVDLMDKMAWGLVVAIIFVGVLDFIPRSRFHQFFGKKDGLQGVVRATLAGVVLDLCSHGILLVGMKLYERGASLGQVVAFLVASPWNSFSMTLILWSLVGLKLTLAFILLSCVVAILSGLIFERLVKNKTLPANPHREVLDFESIEPWFVFPEGLSGGALFVHALKNSLSESKMILRWIFFGVVLTVVVKEVVSPENFQQFFGPDVTGVLLTLLAATVLEVCSEGSAPLASELVTTAHAPGNAFTFLMAGVSTDYTEIMSLKETTKSWKIAFFLPLVTLPQILVIGLLMNKVSF